MPPARIRNTENDEAMVWPEVRTLDKVQLVKRLGSVHPATLQKPLTTQQSVFESG
jgi:outer membrane lipopolysaccharide assembly protein LptE/RlpB